MEDVKIIKKVIKYHLVSTKQRYDLRKQKKGLRKRMTKATTYQEWKTYAHRYDQLKDIKQWKIKVPSYYYDYKYIQYLRTQLLQAREAKQIPKLIHLIRSHSLRNIANIMNQGLYKQCYIGTKDLIEDFQKELELSLKFIEQEELPLQKKLEFFVETRHAVGRTGLVLSGGGLMGMYHIGVIKVLFEENLLPRIITGASAGSLIASLFATKKMEEIPDLFQGDGIVFDAFAKKSPKGQIWRKVKRFITTGVLLDIQTIQQFMTDNIGNITFQEAYDRTGFILNITVTAYERNNQDRILNYLTSPNVCIWSAVSCSCGVPHIYGPSDLYCKVDNGEIKKFMPMGIKFLDGSFSADVPTSRLAELFNVTNFIVSQTNPFMVPIQDFSDDYRYKNYFVMKGIQVMEKIKKLWILEIKHRVQQFHSLGLLPDRSRKYLSLFSQSYTGNITIMPVPNLKDYIYILKNPMNNQQLQRFQQAGAQRTFSKIPYIQSLVHFERVLEECYQELKKQKNEKFMPSSQANDNIEVKQSNFINFYNYQNGEADKKQFKDVRNYSFVIPRTKSKDLLDQIQGYEDDFDGDDEEKILNKKMMF